MSRLPINQQRIEFRKSTIFDLRQGHFLFIALVIVAFACLIIAEVYKSGIGAEGFFHILMSRPERFKGPVYLLLFVMYLLHSQLTAQYERLILASDGIQYRSPWQGYWSFAQRFQPDWSLRWAEIESLQLWGPQNGLNPEIYKVVAKSHNGAERRLTVVSWKSGLADAPAPRMRFMDLLRGFNKAMDQKVRNSPLIKALEARGYAFDTIHQMPRPLEFKPIDGHLGLKSLLVASTIMAPVAAFDWNLTPYAYVGNPPFALLAVVFVAALLIAELLSRDAPKGYRFWVTLVFAISTTALAYPGFMHINAWTADDEPSKYQYVQTRVGVYQSLQSGLPELVFNDNTDYWAHFKLGSEHEFVLIRGALQFDQYDFSSVHSEIYSYYSSH